METIAMGRTAIFIDGAYIDYGLRDQFDLARIDCSLFAQRLANDQEILRTYYYS